MTVSRWLDSCKWDEDAKLCFHTVGKFVFKCCQKLEYVMSAVGLQTFFRTFRIKSILLKHMESNLYYDMLFCCFRTGEYSRFGCKYVLLEYME